MEIHKTTNKQLNDLFNEARHEKPVMNLKEVDQVIKDGKYTPSAGSRGLHIGMNNLIVVCGIVVSSFLAYMALKVDQGELGNAVQPEATEQVSEAPVSNQPGQLQLTDAKQTSEVTTTAHQEPALKVSDRVQPKQNPSTLIASADNDLVVAEKDNDNDEAIVAPTTAKMPSGEYVITFNYAGQDISMKLVGDEVSELFVDGHAIPAEQYGDFDDILAEGKNYLIGNTHDVEGSSSSLNLIKYFDAQLRADNILDKEVQYKFELSSSELMVNGTVQSNEVFKKYKGLYESKTGKTITEGSVYKFERGAKSE